MDATPRKQVPGLSADDATAIRNGLLWLESTPPWAYDLSAEAFYDWYTETMNADETFDPTASTENGFLWEDEDDNEFEHVID